MIVHLSQYDGEERTDGSGKARVVEFRMAEADLGEAGETDENTEDDDTQT